MVLGCVWVPSDPAPLSHSLSTSLSFNLTRSTTPLTFFYSQFHTFSVAPLCELVCYTFGWFHSLKESYHNVIVGCACVCLRACMCYVLLSSMRRIPVRATTSPVAMVVKQAEKEGEEWRETDRQGRGGKLDDECMFWTKPRKEGRGGKDW